MSVDLRAMRIRRGLTLPQFAEQVDLPYHVVRRAEQGKPIREDSAKRIADFYEIDALVLVDPPKETAA